LASTLALHGAQPVIKDPLPHYRWPPQIPELPGVISRYVAEGHPLSIVDRSGIYARLEDRFCELHKRRYAILTSSGTMALYSAFFGLDLKPGDEVISTVYSFHATATPLLHLGVHVVFCDVEPDTGNIDTTQIENLITPRTRAIVTNHMWGHPVEVDAVSAVCGNHGLAWVEDCSHAHFSEYRGERVGTFGDAAVFSLQGNKLLTGGEGGVLLTDDTEIYERATLLGHSLKRSSDCVKNKKWSGILRTGFGLKFRMHPLAAVMIWHLLENHCFEWIESRAKTLGYFSDGLAATGSVVPMARRDYVTSMGAHYGFKPRMDFAGLGLEREKFVAALRAEGLDVKIPGSLPFYNLPVFEPHRYPIGKFSKSDNNGRSFKGAERYHGSILSLPTFSFPQDVPLIDRYVDAFHKVLSHREELI
jgi:dTDP-4-amino-4,6-dideoxygalactose transaminase